MEDQKEDSFSTPEKIVKSLSIGEQQTSSGSKGTQPAFSGEAVPLGMPVPVRKLSYDETKNELDLIDDDLKGLKQTMPLHLVGRDEIVKEVFK